MASNVIVTGASRGLGLAITAKLLRVGFDVIAIARKRQAALERLAAQAGGDHGTLHFFPFDLADCAQIPSLVRTLHSDFGRFHGLVNNAGLGTSGALAIMHHTQIEALIRLNTLAPILLTKHVVRHMLADGGGRIVNISSIVATTGYSGLSVYAATKASLVGFTRSLAREVGRAGITVNAVAPGFIDTEMTNELQGSEREQVVRRSALRRLAEPEDVAESVAYLLGPQAKNITGTVLTVDAGSTA